MIETKSSLQHWRELEIPGAKEFTLEEGKMIDGLPIAKFGPGAKKYLLPVIEKNVPSIKIILYRLRREIATSVLYYELGDPGTINIQVAHFFNFLIKIAGHSGRYVAYLGKNHLLYADWQEIEGGWFIEYFSGDYSITELYPYGSLILARANDN